MYYATAEEEFRGVYKTKPKTKNK